MDEQKTGLYTVREETRTKYIEMPYETKRIPMDYDVFTVVDPEGKDIQSFSGYDYGLDEAKQNAYRVADLRNAELIPQQLDAAKTRIAELEAENSVLNRKLVMANQYVGYLQAALEEIGSWPSVSLNRARVKQVIARALGSKG